MPYAATKTNKKTTKNSSLPLLSLVVQVACLNCNNILLLSASLLKTHDLKQPFLMQIWLCPHILLYTAPSPDQCIQRAGYPSLQRLCQFCSVQDVLSFPHLVHTCPLSQISIQASCTQENPSWCPRLRLPSFLLCSQNLPCLPTLPGRAFTALKPLHNYLRIRQ